jgi:hypothetical protein
MRTFTRRNFVTTTLVAGLAACARTLYPTAPIANYLVKIHARASWQAREPDLNAPAEHGLFDPEFNPDGWLMYSQPLGEVYKTLIVHHSALDLTYGPYQIQELHMHNKGYADIGYHYLIDEAGRVSEGRYIRARGAHTGGYNTGTIGVVLLGNFEEGKPPLAQQQALQNLGGHLTHTYSLTHLAGHRDFQPGVTVCPGVHLESTLVDLAKTLGLTFGTGGYVKPGWAK